MERLQSLLRLVYPPRCMTCPAEVTTDFGLCAACWRETYFISGLVCDACGTPLPGDSGVGDVPGDAPLCDDCIAIARPWSQGRAALLYRDKGRRIALSLKYGDRLDLVRPAGAWMARAAAPMLRPGMLVAPVPMHWTRLFRRRYNQAALLARAVARETGLDVCPDLLIRPRRTPTQDGRNREARFANVADAIRPHPARAGRMAGRPVLIVDDVLTSGATLAAATEACLFAGAGPVCVLALARVAKDA